MQQSGGLSENGGPGSLDSHLWYNRTGFLIARGIVTVPELISLFCGPGGFDEGFCAAGFTTRLAYDNDKACVATHRHNHPEAGALQADLSVIDVDAIIRVWEERAPGIAPTGLIGGPPCQSFSVSNVHQTEDDPRHKLPEHYARILARLNQEYSIPFFVFENVPGLITPKHQEKFGQFKAMFENAGFDIFEESLDAKDYGVPQDRQRVFIVGTNRALYPGFRFTFPRPTHPQPLTVEDAIAGLPEPVPFLKGLTARGYPHPNHWCMAPKSPKFTTGIMTPGLIMGRSFRVLAWDQPSYTVAYGHREVHVHPSGRRRLSVYEAMLLQGFPPTYELKGTLSDQIRLVSEAVAPPVAQALAEALMDQLQLGNRQIHLRAPAEHAGIPVQV